MSSSSDRYYVADIASELDSDESRGRLVQRLRQYLEVRNLTVLVGKAIARITEDIRSVFGFRTLNIEASDAHRTLAVWIDERQYRLAELGSGLSQFVVIFGNAGIKSPPLILIDEPEISANRVPNSSRSVL